MFAIAVLMLYLLVFLLVAGLVLQGTAWYRRHRVAPREDLPPPGFEQTDETYIDPTTGVRQRVWYNPATGERYYESLTNHQDPRH